MSTSTDRLVTQIPADQHHPLKDTWTFWYLIIGGSSPQKSWETMLKQLGDFSSVEDFWGVMNSVNAPATLPASCRYYIFKKGVKPLWEDKANNGGHQVFCTFNDVKKEGRRELQEKWEHLAAMIVGSSFGDYDLVNGVECTIRKNAVTIGVWVGVVDPMRLDQVKRNLCLKLAFTGMAETKDIIVSEADGQ